MAAAGKPAAAAAAAIAEAIKFARHKDPARRREAAMVSEGEGETCVEWAARQTSMCVCVCVCVCVRACVCVCVCVCVCREGTFVEWAARRSSMGRRKAAVLPEPVRAMATTSWPRMMSGIVFRWMGVGTRYLPPPRDQPSICRNGAGGRISMRVLSFPLAFEYSPSWKEPATGVGHAKDDSW